MKARPPTSLLLVFTLTAVSLPASAQSLNRQALIAKMQDKVLLLRGRYVCPSARPRPCKLVFDR